MIRTLPSVSLTRLLEGLQGPCRLEGIRIQGEGSIGHHIEGFRVVWLWGGCIAASICRL